MPAPTPPEVTVVMFPDGTVETADNVKSATIPIAVYDALVSSTPPSEDGKANNALRAYMDTHGSYLDE